MFDRPEDDDLTIREEGTTPDGVAANTGEAGDAEAPELIDPLGCLGVTESSELVAVGIIFRASIVGDLKELATLLSVLLLLVGKFGMTCRFCGGGGGGFRFGFPIRPLPLGGELEVAETGERIPAPFIGDGKKSNENGNCS